MFQDTLMSSAADTVSFRRPERPVIVGAGTERAELRCQLLGLFPALPSAGATGTQARRKLRGRPARKEMQPRAPYHHEISTFVALESIT